MLRIVLVGAASYVSLVLLLRLMGKRVLAKLNAFDLVVTVPSGRCWPVRCSARTSGHGDLDAIAAVVLEPDGTLSVIGRSSSGDEQALAQVPKWEPTAPA